MASIQLPASSDAGEVSFPDPNRDMGYIAASKTKPALSFVPETSIYIDAEDGSSLAFDTTMLAVPLDISFNISTFGDNSGLGFIEPTNENQYVIGLGIGKEDEKWDLPSVDFSHESYHH